MEFFFSRHTEPERGDFPRFFFWHLSPLLSCTPFFAPSSPLQLVPQGMICFVWRCPPFLPFFTSFSLSGFNFSYSETFFFDFPPHFFTFSPPSGKDAPWFSVVPPPGSGLTKLRPIADAVSFFFSSWFPLSAYNLAEASCSPNGSVTFPRCLDGPPPPPFYCVIFWSKL